MLFMGIHRLGLKVDNLTKLVATSVERGRGLNAGMFTQIGTGTGFTEPTTLEIKIRVILKI